MAGHTDTTDTVVATFDADRSGTRGCVIFASNTLDVNNTNYKLVYINNIGTFMNTVKVTISAAELHNAGFVSGQVVYYAAYPYVSHDYSAYANFNTGKTIFSAVGTKLTAATQAP